MKLSHQYVIACPRSEEVFSFPQHNAGPKCDDFANDDQLLQIHSTSRKLIPIYKPHMAPVLILVTNHILTSILCNSNSVS